MLLTTGRTPHYPLASGGVWGRGAAAEGRVRRREWNIGLAGDWAAKEE